MASQGDNSVGAGDPDAESVEAQESEVEERSEGNSDPVPDNGDDVDPDAKTIANEDGRLQAAPYEETFANSEDADRQEGVQIPKPSDVKTGADADGDADGEATRAAGADDTGGGGDGAESESVPSDGIREVDETDSEGREQAESLGDLTGRTLSGRYELVDRIGGGGMGEVYRAEHSLIKKQVAIKLLYPELAGDSVIERFRREAQASAHIDHPNICASTDFGETDDGIFYLVMEYLDGRTLDEVLDDEGTFEPARAIHIARQICAALEQADELDIIHRDLKPENVMLVRRGSDEDFVKLLDFGIARVRMGQEAKLTQTGMVFGTPNFMSPEQAAGDPMDHRADLYAVGLLLFQMLTGRPPFQAERGSQVMAMHVSQDPPSPSAIASQSIPAELESLILELLAKEPSERPDSATDVRERLDDLYHSQEGVRRARPADRSAQSIERTQQLPARGDDADLVVGESGWFDSGWKRLQVPWPIAAGVALLAFAMGVGAMAGVDALRGGDEIPSVGQLSGTSAESNLGPLARQHREFLKRPQVRAAMQAYKNGSNQTAIDKLEAITDPTKTQPHLAHQLGKLYADNGDWSDSMRSYRSALSEEPGFLQDPELVNDVFTAFQVDEESVATEAHRILSQFIHRDRIQRRLVDLSWKDDDYVSRERAYDLLRSKGVVARLPAWERLSVELRHSTGCEEHREVIDRLVSLDDPRGLRILEIYDNYPETGCGESNEQDCYGCIRDSLNEAIQALEAARTRGEGAGTPATADTSGSRDAGASDGTSTETQSSSSNSSP